MIVWLTVIQFGVGCLILVVSLICWIFALDTWARGRPLLAWEPRRHVPWNIMDMLLIALFGGMLLMVGQVFVARRHGIDLASVPLESLPLQVRLEILTAFSVSGLFVTAAVIVYLTFVRGAKWTDMGWTLAGGLRDGAIGVVGFFMLVVPMLLVHALARWILQSQETHPFIDIILREPRWNYLLPIGFMALVVAPLMEEFLFRGILQGWLERCVIPLDEQGYPAVDPLRDEPQVAGAELETQVVEPQNIETQQVVQVGRADARPAARYAEAHPLLWLPIAMSSLLFAAAHLGQGPAPIPLFLLALGLGYIYQRTHRLLPSIVVHFLVNLLAIGQLVLEILKQQIPT